MKTNMIGKNKNQMFYLLKSRDVLDILIGDKKFETIDGIEISMPNLSGSAIVSISQLFGMSVTYSLAGGALSRWAYMQNLIQYGINTNKIQDILAYLFQKKQFEQMLAGKSPEIIERLYSQIYKIIIEKINGVLYFSGFKLNVIKGRFYIIPLNQTIKLETPEVRNIDREYIKNISDRAMNDIVEKNYDSALTKSRTLLEEIFIYVIEKKQTQPSGKGNIGQLYKQVKDLYNMHTDKDIDRRINTLLSGLEKIVTSIAEMRNINSDSHGVGSRRVTISEHHARLLVNSAMIMSEFILSISNNT